MWWYLFSSACIKPVISPNRKFNQSSILSHSGFNNMFPTVQGTNHFVEVGWLKKMKHIVLYQYPTCISCFVKDELISFGILYIFKWKKNVLQMFFFNLVKRKVHLFTNKQEFLTLLHLRSFRQFQNLSEETWSHVAENLIELCFIAFLKVRNVSNLFE